MISLSILTVYFLSTIWIPWDKSYFDKAIMMATTQKEHYFYPGKKGKTGRSGPGILVVEGKFKFRVNQVNKANTLYRMYCVQGGFERLSQRNRG